MQTTYTVTGRWPFPLDMLRYDSAEPASAEDRQRIERLSVEHPASLEVLREKVSVSLVTELKPYHLSMHARRWESFGWRVVGHETPPKRVPKDWNALRRSALAKLTADEREALEI